MEIKIWGCRGSLPTPGPKSVRYGGNTSCLEIKLRDETIIILDAGSGIKLLGDAIVERGSPKEVYLFLTHSHWDHLLGFPFFKPAYIPDFRINVRGGHDATKCLKKYLAHQMEPPYFPVDFELLNAEFDFRNGNPKKKEIGTAEIFPIPLNHPNGGFGYKFVEDNKSFVFLTDNELFFDHKGGLKRNDYIELCRGADLLLHDAQYNEKEYSSMTRGWGHTTHLQAAQFAVDAGVKRFGLFHHDPSHNDNDLDAFVNESRLYIEKQGGPAECFGCKEGMEIRV